MLLNQQDVDRKRTRLILTIVSVCATLTISAALLWALRALLLPILVGGFLAYLFRPLKTFFRTPWLPDELRMLILIGLLLTGVAFLTNYLRQSIPGERDTLELRVRMQYKLNQKFSQVMGITEDKKQGNLLNQLLGRELNPLMDHMNDLLSLTPTEQIQFQRYYKGYQGEPLISDKFYSYYKANLLHSRFAEVAEESLHAAENQDSSTSNEQIKGKAQAGLLSALSAWILAPLIFIFLLFDNGQIHRYIMSLVPNKYFEMTLTIADELDDAIGAYLRGTMLECFFVGLTFFVGFIALGFPLSAAFAISFIAGLTNAIPFLGTVIGLVIGVGYALIIEGAQPWIPGLTGDDLALGVIGLVFFAHFLDNAVFQPIVLGHSVNLHPIIVIVGVIGGSVAFGFVGMLLAIPTMVVVKTALETMFRDLKAYRII